jgi:hypothetical protein
MTFPLRRVITVAILRYMVRSRISRKGSRQMRITKSIGMILLAIWLILTGLIALFNLSFQGIGLIMGILAVAAGILILVER